MTNPKDLVGVTKPRLYLVPGSSIVMQAVAMQNGADKYGPYNWRDEKVSAVIYAEAAMRHILAWIDGEECASDSGIHHLAHALASLGIVIDAQVTDSLIDDRPKPGKTAEVIARYTSGKR